MLYPPCPICGEPTQRTTAVSLALDLAGTGRPFPRTLRGYVENLGALPVLICTSCSWWRRLVYRLAGSSPQLTA